jgi:hypothetical protein
MTATAWARGTLPANWQEALDLLRPHWPSEGGRHPAYRALVGGLLRGRWSEDNTRRFVQAMADATDDEEAEKRLALVGDTAGRLHDKKPVTGWPKLAQLLGPGGGEVVESLQVVLGIGKQIEAVYDYRDEAGCLLFQAVRYRNPKDFRQRRPQGLNPRNDHPEDWVWDLQGVARVLYRLPELRAADPAAPVFVPEGEKDVDNLRELGLVAVTNPMGAGKWLPIFNAVLRGRHVVVLPDNDDPGQQHARAVASSLATVAASVKVLALDGLSPGGDVSDWLAAGGTAEGLLQLAGSARPWEANSVPAAPTFPEPPAWPDPPGEEAFHGLAGRVVDEIDPASEADRAALLVQTIVAFGSAIGRGAYFSVEGVRHHGNEFAVLVGPSSKARKGTSWGRVSQLYREAEEAWAAERVQTGLSSGEGLIWAVRDPITKQERVKERGELVHYETVEADPGVQDKRLLVYEPEFSNVLKQTERQGNTVSPVLRQAWDGNDLRSMTKNSPARATAAHVSLVGHITADELRRYLRLTEVANGYGNRHLWLCAARSKLLPEGGQVDPDTWDSLRGELVEALAFAKAPREMTRDEEARAIWYDIYGPLSEGRPGLAGALLARAEAHVTRLAMLYALMDRAAVIGAEHLLAALALWDYVERSVLFVFGDSLGDPVADDLLRLLRSCPTGLTRNDMTNHFGRHQSSDRIGRALGLLLQHGLARREQEQTGGRPAERWFAVAKGSAG